MNREGRLTPSEAAQRRQVLAKERRDPDKLIRQGIRELSKAEDRLRKVSGLLNSKGEKTEELSTEEKVNLVSLEIELIWLEFRLLRISQADKDSQLDKKLNELEKEDPDLYDWLTTESEGELAPLARIRDSVIPPIKMGGYHTKRRL